MEFTCANKSGESRGGMRQKPYSQIKKYYIIVNRKVILL